MVANFSQTNFAYNFHATFKFLFLFSLDDIPNIPFFVISLEYLAEIQLWRTSSKKTINRTDHLQ